MEDVITERGTGATDGVIRASGVTDGVIKRGGIMEDVITEKGTEGQVLLMMSLGRERQVLLTLPSKTDRQSFSSEYLICKQTVKRVRQLRTTAEVKYTIIITFIITIIMGAEQLSCPISVSHLSVCLPASLLTN
ncbi:hypothetical protein PAMP_006501 [Pampus punctatissimus]